MLEFIKQPWHWSVTGVLIGLTVPLLLILGNKTFGISSNLKHICAICIPAEIPYFKYDWKKHIWNLFFIGGVVVGGAIAQLLLNNHEPIVIAEKTKAALTEEGITTFVSLLPDDLFSFKSLLTLRGFIFIVIGGFCVGFGTRWAEGCTSGHAIMGLSNLQWPSLVATICFMIGGIFTTWFIIPFLLSL